MGNQTGGHAGAASHPTDFESDATGVAGHARAAASAIARSLCQTALWDEEHSECTWMGRSDQEIPDPSGMSVSNAALGAHLYGGTAGIGLFLAEMSGVTDDPVIATTAAGAVRRSCRHLNHRPPPKSPLSLFSGHLGVIYAARRLPQGPAGAEVRGEASALLHRVRESVDEPSSLDVVLGTASAIPTLLLLAGTEDSHDLRDLAVRLGEDLCRRATWSDGTCSWDAQEASGEAFDYPPLTGFAHGASGMALALFELFRSTGEERFLTTARGAFAYEDTHYVAAERNWVDTRLPHQHIGGDAVGTCRVAWCHGGPGIALARARAAACDPEWGDEHAALARTALDMTVTAAAPLLEIDRYDASLCHGLSGLAEILLIGACELDEPAYAIAAQEIAGALMNRYASSGDWPSGVAAGGPNPSLMIGTAGIGHHLMRLANPRSVPPILILRP